MIYKLKHNKAFKNFYTIGVYSALTRLLGFLFKIALSRMLGAEGLGLFSVSLSLLFTYLAIACSGIPTTLTRRVASEIACGRDGTRYVSGALFLSASISVTLIIITFMGHGYLNILFKDSASAIIFFCLLPTLISSVFYTNIRSWFMGKGDFKTFSKTELLEEIVKIILALSLYLLLKEYIPSYVLIAVCFTISDYVCAGYLIVKYIKNKGRFTRPQYLGELIKSAAPLSTTRVCGSIISTIIATTLPAALTLYGLSPLSAAAEYGRLSGMVLPMLTAPLNLTAIPVLLLIPEVAALNAMGKHAELFGKIKKAMLFALCTGGIFSLSYLLFGDTLCRILFKDNSAGKILKMMSGLALILCINQVCVSMINSLGYESFSFPVFVVSSVPQLLCIILLTRQKGIYGAVIGYYFQSIIAAIMNGAKLYACYSFRMRSRSARSRHPIYLSRRIGNHIPSNDS